MIKDFTPMPFEGINPLPDYVSNVRAYTLIGTVPGGYKVTLAKLTVGDSMSAGNPLAHACRRSEYLHLSVFHRQSAPTTAIR